MGGAVRNTTPSDHLDLARARRFRRLVTALNKLLEDVRRDYPEANYYLQEDNLHILSGPSHEGHRQTAQEHRELISETLRHSGGGGW